MQNFTCNHCGKNWSSTEISASIQDFGFVNLTSQDEEIVAFSCPDNKCSSSIVFMGQPGISSEFLDHFETLPDSKGRVFQSAEFKYHAFLPLFEENTLVLQNVNPIFSLLSSIDYFESEQALFTSESPELDIDYYCSFNSHRQEATSSSFTVWWYQKNDIEALFALEQSNRLRIFPRYMKYHDLLCEIDEFCWNHHLEKLFFDGMQSNLLSMLTCSLDKVDIAKQYGFLEILTPPRVLLGKKDDKFENSHLKSNTIWKEFHKEFVREQLLSQSELFIREYLEQYSRTYFSLTHVEELIARYRNKIYDGLTSRRKKERAQQETIEDLIKQADKDAPAFKDIISKNEEVLRLKLELNRLVRNNKKPFSILLTGETGTGKTLFAKAIHGASGRSGKFLNVNANSHEGTFESTFFGHKKGAFSGAISDKVGLFQAADNGTLFLDEIGELDMRLQIKLLKVIEEGFAMPLGSTVPEYFNVFMLFCTNKDLVKAVEDGTFRRDLYYRINDFHYTIPPLRKRKVDILPLALHFVRKFAEEYDRERLAGLRISKDALDLLHSHSWPGNTRELEKLMIRIIKIRDHDDIRDISFNEIKQNIKEERNEPRQIPDNDESFSQHNFDSDKPPVFKPAPGNRDMPSVEDVVELLEYFHAKEKKKRGLPKKVADHIGVSERHFKYWIQKHNIVYPWRK